MTPFLLLAPDTSVLDQASSTLQQALQGVWGGSVSHIAPVLFAESTCLTQFVYEEIDLVVASQVRHGMHRLDMDEFIRHWEWEDKLDLALTQLSGGWRKILSMSLFFNQRCQQSLVVDFATHLSDATIASLLCRIRALRPGRVAFAEYDPAILAAHLPDATTIELALPSRVAEPGAQ